jgi:hypothetical protein
MVCARDKRMPTFNYYNGVIMAEHNRVKKKIEQCILYFNSRQFHYEKIFEKEDSAVIRFYPYEGDEGFVDLFIFEDSCSLSFPFPINDNGKIDLDKRQIYKLAALEASLKTKLASIIIKKNSDGDDFAVSELTIYQESTEDFFPYFDNLTAAVFSGAFHFNEQLKTLLEETVGRPETRREDWHEGNIESCRDDMSIEPRVNEAQKCHDYPEKKSEVEISEQSTFPSTLLARLQKRNRDTPFEELCSIELELGQFLEKENKTIYDEWLAYATLANLLSNKIVVLITGGKNVSDEIINCLEKFEQSFMLGSQISLNDSDINWINTGKEAYLNVLNIWINQNIDMLVSEENQKNKISNFRILEERLSKGIYFGSESHEKYNDLVVKLKHVRDILNIYDEIPSGVDIASKKFRSSSSLTDIGTIKKDADTRRNFKIEYFYELFRKIPFSGNTKTLSLSAIGIVCLVLIISFFLFSKKPPEHLATQKPSSQEAPTTTVNVSLPQNKKVTASDTAIPQTAPQQASEPFVVKTSESQPKNTSAWSTTMNPNDRADTQAGSSDAKSSTDPQTLSSGNNSNRNVDNSSTMANQIEKTENGQLNAPAIDLLDNIDSTNGDLKRIHQGLTNTSVVSDKTENKRIHLEKEPSKAKSRCGSLYIKLSLGKVLNREEVNFLSHNCN